MTDPESRTDLESSETLADRQTQPAPAAAAASASERPSVVALRDGDTADGDGDGGGDDRATSGAWRIGQSLGERYTLLERLGRGGMSEVYLARHELLKKNVAVKVLRPDIAVTKASLSRFHREAMAAASIGNPHIVDITDYGFTDDGNAFIVMERLVGADLRTTLGNAGALPAGRSVSIIRQVLRGLAAAHAQGIVHRDLKAENVFLCRRDHGSEVGEGGEFVKLLDFGISKVTWPLDDSPDGALLRTSTGAVLGTPQYIAPEQAHGDRDVDHRVDIYSAGVMLYEMLTGQLPFTGKSALDVVMKHVQEEPEPPRRRRPDLDIAPDLDRVVLRAMAKDRDQRFATAEEMLATLPEPATLPGGFSSVTLSAASVAPAARTWPYLVVIAALLAAGAGVLFWVFPDVPAERRLAGASAVPREQSRPARRTRLAVGPPGSAAAVPASGGAVSGGAESASTASDAGVSPVANGALSAAASPAQVTLRVAVWPATARIHEGSQLVGTGKLRRTVRRGSAPVTLLVRAPGYRQRRIELQTDHSQTLEIQLERQENDASEAQGSSLPAVTGPADLHDNPYLRKSRESGRQRER